MPRSSNLRRIFPLSYRHLLKKRAREAGNTSKHTIKLGRDAVL